LSLTETAEAISCLGPCFPDPEICDNDLDDDGDGLIDCEDPDLMTECCCRSLPILTLGRDTTLCPGDVLRAMTTDTTFTTYRWSTGETVDSLVIREPGTYWLTATDDCGNEASDTIRLHPRPRPNLNLGNDTTVCANATIPLRAQDGFARYEWVDGTTEQDFTAYGEGDFWIIATDSCGNVSRDTVTVIVDETTKIDLGPDRLICLGDTVTFSVPGYSDYQWARSTFIDCLDCPTVRFAPTMDTLLLLAATQGPGCFSSDSVRVRVVRAVGGRDTAYLCPGDSILLGDQVIFTAGRYYGSPGNERCPSVDTLDVFQLRDTTVRETRTICAGDSTLIFGDFQVAAGEYVQQLTGANGCDSQTLVMLTVLESFFNVDTVSVCSGDSALLFGNYESVTGPYTQTFSASNGCDSTQLIYLKSTNWMPRATRSVRGVLAISRLALLR